MFTSIVTYSILFFNLLSVSTTKDVILSAGIGGYDENKLNDLYQNYKFYSEQKVITFASILTYYIDENGYMQSHNTSTKNDAQSFQHFIKSNLGLKALPCIFCDETIGACCNLEDRMNRVYERQDQFIEESINIGLKYGWDGYAVDFEIARTIDMDLLTNFVLKWSDALYKNNMILDIWIGGDTFYNMSALYDSNTTFHLVTMNTYVSTYEIFVRNANIDLERINNATKLGYGLLTTKYNKYAYKNDVITISNDDMEQIVDWCIKNDAYALSVWATGIPSNWINALKRFIKSN